MVRTTSGLTGVSTGSSFVNSGSKFNTSRLFFCNIWKKWIKIRIRIWLWKIKKIDKKCRNFVWLLLQKKKSRVLVWIFAQKLEKRKKWDFLSDFETAWKTIKSYNFGSEWRFDLSILEILPFDVLEENVMFDGLFASMRRYASQSLRYIFLHELQRRKNTSKYRKSAQNLFPDYFFTPLRTETASLDNQTG